MKKNKRSWFKHYDSMPIEEAIKMLTDHISQIKSREDRCAHDSYIKDMEAQRDEYKRRLK